MLKQEEYICKNGVVLTHTWSDEDYYIEQVETGTIYADAYDIPNTYTYKETDVKIENKE